MLNSNRLIVDCDSAGMFRLGRPGSGSTVPPGIAVGIRWGRTSNPSPKSQFLPPMSGGPANWVLMADEGGNLSLRNASVSPLQAMSLAGATSLVLGANPARAEVPMEAFAVVGGKVVHSAMLGTAWTAFRFVAEMPCGIGTPRISISRNRRNLLDVAICTDRGIFQAVQLSAGVFSEWTVVQDLAPPSNTGGDKGCRMAVFVAREPVADGAWLSWR